jgi:hypothetical protein
MDIQSQNTVLLLNALAKTTDQLSTFGYNLYLKTKAYSWKQPRTVHVSGEGFRITQNQQSQQFERALSFGFSINCDSIKERVIIFSLLVAWNSTNWFIQSFVEEEDNSREVITCFL